MTQGLVEAALTADLIRHSKIEFSDRLAQHQRIALSSRLSAPFTEIHCNGLERQSFEQVWSHIHGQRVMNINVTGCWRCAKVVTQPMKEAGGGSIVNIASLAAMHGLVNGAHYATSKAAVIGLSRTLARELGRYWIRVNSVAPSAVMTEGTSEFMGERLERAKEAIAAVQSLRRNLETDDLVGTVLFLASDASKFVSGQTIMVDGGTHFL